MTTPLGKLYLFGVNNTLAGCQFLTGDNILYFEESLANKFSSLGFERSDNDPFLKDVKRQLRAYFKGKLFEFQIPLPEFTDSFTDRVLAFVKTIPYGFTVSYKDVAFALNSGAVRAVGSAIGKCTTSIVIPCHRVITSNGKLGGYGNGQHGLDTKLALLGLEGVNL